MDVQNEINVIVRVDTTYYEQVAKKATNLGKQFAFGVSDALGIAAEGARILNEYMQESITLAQIQEDAEKKLETALGRRSQALLSQASALQEVTTYGDEAIIGAQALIAAFVKDEEQIKAATQATLDFAAATGMDLSEATDLVAKTVGTSTNALSDYGITVEGAVGSTERLDTMTTAIAEKFGGQASAAAETYSGKIQQLSNRYTNMKEQIGFAVLESGAFDAVLDALNPAVDELTRYITDHKDEIGVFARHLGEMGADVVRNAPGYIDKITTEAGELYNTLKPMIDLVGKYPEILEYGIIGAIVAGRKGAIAGTIAGLTKGLFEEDPASKPLRDFEVSKLEYTLGIYNHEIDAGVGSWNKQTDAVKRIQSETDYIKSTYDERRRVYEVFRNDMRALKEKYDKEEEESKGNGSGSGGSGTGNEDAYREGLKKRVEALQQSLMDEKGALEVWRKEQLALVTEYNNNFTGKEEEARQMRIDIARRYKEQMAEIEGIPAFESEMEQLQEQNKTKAEMELEEYQNRLARLEEFKMKDAEIFEKYEEYKNAIEEDYAKKRQRREQQVEETIRRMKWQTLQQAMSALQIFARESKAVAIAAIALNKAEQIAQIQINTASAIMKAYAVFGPVKGAPFAAKMALMGKIQTGIAVAAGLGQAMNVISGSSSYSSSSTVASTSGGTTTASTTTTTPDETMTRSVTIYGLDPNNLYTGEQIAELMNDYVADGGKIYIK